MHSTLPQKLLQLHTTHRDLDESWSHWKWFQTFEPKSNCHHNKSEICEIIDAVVFTFLRPWLKARIIQSYMTMWTQGWFHERFERECFIQPANSCWFWFLLLLLLLLLYVLVDLFVFWQSRRSSSYLPWLTKFYCNALLWCFFWIVQIPHEIWF